MSMRLRDTEHTARPRWFHEIAPASWVGEAPAYRLPGTGQDDLPFMLAALWTASGLYNHPLVVWFLFAGRARPLR